MKHLITSLNTKKMLAASLKKFMGQKPLSKVTVSEIISDCGVNRKTFYYHFEDLYALLKWILEEEAIEVVKSFDLLVDYEEAIMFVINYVENNKHILSCAYDSIGRDELKRFFCSDFLELTRSIIDSAEEELSIQVDEGFKNLLCKFYTEAIAGILIDWFTDSTANLSQNREETIQNISLIFRASVPSILTMKSINF